MNRADERRRERILILRTLLNDGGEMRAFDVADRASTECDREDLDDLPPVSRRSIGQKLAALEKQGLVYRRQNWRADNRVGPTLWGLTFEGKTVANRTLPKPEYTPVPMPSLENFELTGMEDLGDEHEALILPVANVAFIWRTPENVRSWIRILTAGAEFLEKQRAESRAGGNPG